VEEKRFNENAPPGGWSMRLEAFPSVSVTSCRACGAKCA